MGAEVAEYLGIPNISNVLSIDDVRDEKVFLTANLDDKIIRCSIALPCLISMDGDINTPRLPSYRIKKALKENTVNFLTFTDFQDQDPAHYGLTGSATQVERIFPPEKNSEKVTVKGSSQEQTDAVFALLRDKKML